MVVNRQQRLFDAVDSVESFQIFKLNNELRISISISLGDKVFIFILYKHALQDPEAQKEDFDSCFPFLITEDQSIANLNQPEVFNHLLLLALL